MVDNATRFNGERRQIVPWSEDNDTMPKGAVQLDKAHPDEVDAPASPVTRNNQVWG
jgi:hypothetical protein